MEKNFTFSGISMQSIDKSILDRDFDCVFEDDSIYYESKKTYEHREDGLNFDYKYFIVVEDIRGLTGEKDADIIVSLYLVPTFEYWNEKDKEGIMCFIGADSIEDVCLYDAIMGYGNNVIMACDSIKPNEDTTIDDECVTEMVHTCANCVSAIDSLRGFYLDKYVNRIGTTGWDIVEHVVDSSYDFINEALNRYKA